MSQITFTAYLRAYPQGSKRHVGHGVMVEQSKGVKPYRHDLALIAQVEKQRWFLSWKPESTQGLGLTLDFYFLKPKSSKRKHPSVKPDIDKLCRATMDALTGILFADDSQVCELNARKHYCIVERVEISCYTLSPSVPAFQKEVKSCKKDEATQ